MENIEETELTFLLNSNLSLIDDGILFVGNNIIHYNKSFINLFNIPIEVLHQSVINIFSYISKQTIDPDEFLNNIKNISDSRERFIYRVSLLDNKTVEYSSELYIENDELKGRVWVFKDKSSRVHLERELLLTNEKYKKAFESSSDYILITSLPEGKIISANPKFLYSYGKKEEEIIGKTTVELGLWKFKDDRKFILTKVLNNEEVKNFETIMVLPEKEVWCSISFNIIVLGNSKCMLSVVRDISDRKQKELYRSLIDRIFYYLSEVSDFNEAINSILHIIKEKTGISSIGIRFSKNGDFPYFASIGFSKEFIDLEDSILGCSNNELDCLCGAVISNTTSLLTHNGTFWTNNIPEKLNTDLEIPYRGNCLKHGYNSIALIPMKNKNIVIGLIQFNDERNNFFNRDIIEYLETISFHIGAAFVKNQLINDRWEFEATLHQAQRIESMSILAAGIAHDLNNILFPITGLTELLLNESEQGSVEHTSLTQIHKSAKRGASLVRQILTFCNIESNKIPIRISSVIKEIIRLSRSTIPQTFPISCTVDEDLGILVIDPTHIHQMVTNLLLNAYYAVKQSGGEIKVTVKKETFTIPPFEARYLPKGDYISIRVYDNGKSINQSMISKLFDPYFTINPQSHGLGLSTVYRLVKDNKGDIRVFPEEKGTTFVIYLPIENISYTGSSEKILLVDDEEPVLFLEHSVLEKQGYEVVSMTNSVEALEVFKNDKFDLVIIDKNMPGISGIELYRIMHKMNPKIGYIFCTGICSKEEEIKLKAMGVKHILLKPVPIEVLLKTVQNVLLNLKVGAK